MRRNPVFIILGVLFALNILAWVAVYDLSKGAKLLEVTFFDVGQGDSILIETPSGHQVLIDGGPDSTILEKLGKEMIFWDRIIDLIILTHPEHDHIAGLIDVFKRYKVENILWTGVLRDTAEFKEWQRLIQEEGAQIFIARAGQQIVLPRLSLGHDDQGLASTVYLDVLWPIESLERQEVKNTNNTSIVVKLVFGDNSFLFTGDAYQVVERELIAKYIDIDADVLKVGHHGSKTSSAAEFIEAVSPEIAVILAGQNNSYGHPHLEVLEILENYGTTILRTDINGDIKIISNGEDYVSTF